MFQEYRPYAGIMWEVKEAGLVDWARRGLTSVGQRLSNWGSTLTNRAQQVGQRASHAPVPGAPTPRAALPPRSPSAPSSPYVPDEVIAPVSRHAAPRPAAPRPAAPRPAAPAPAPAPAQSQALVKHTPTVPTAQPHTPFWNTQRREMAMQLGVPAGLSAAHSVVKDMRDPNATWAGTAGRAVMSAGLGAAGGYAGGKALARFAPQYASRAGLRSATWGAGTLAGTAFR